jgi:hypothetical protein
VRSGTNWDYATIKYNSNGDSLWVRRYNYGVSNNTANALAVDDTQAMSMSLGGALEVELTRIMPLSNMIKMETLYGRGGIMDRET